MHTVPRSDPERDHRRLDVPTDVLADEHAVELVSAWFSSGKVKILTRSRTGLAERPATWAEIVAGIVDNIATSIEGETGVCVPETLSVIRESLERYFKGRTGNRTSQ